MGVYVACLKSQYRSIDFTPAMNYEHLDEPSLTVGLLPRLVACQPTFTLTFFGFVGQTCQQK